MITASIVARNHDYLVADEEIHTIDDFEALEQRAIATGKICRIIWCRDSDGQVGYWTPEGAYHEPHWYNAGQPKKPSRLKKRPTTIKLSGWVLDWLDGHDRPKAQLIEQAVISQYGLNVDKNK